MKKYLILGGIIVLSGIAINYFLGGFEQLKPEHVEINDMTIFGKSYEGRYASDSLDNIITSLNNLIKSDTSGALIIVNYLQEDLEKRGVVKQFVGIIWPHSPQRNLELDTLQLPEVKAVRFNIPINPLVMPSPEKLKNMAIDEAALYGNKLKGYSVEQYRDKLLIVSFPVE